MPPKLGYKQSAEPFMFPFELTGDAYRVDGRALRGAMRAIGRYGRARVDRGLQTAEAFSWERCARAIVERCPVVLCLS